MMYDLVWISAMQFGKREKMYTSINEEFFPFKCTFDLKIEILQLCSLVQRQEEASKWQQKK